MLNTFINKQTNTVVTVTELACYTVDSQDDVTVTDPSIIADYCEAQMGDEYDFMGFIERLYEAGYELA